MNWVGVGENKVRRDSRGAFIKRPRERGEYVYTQTGRQSKEKKTERVPIIEDSRMEIRDWTNGRTNKVYRRVARVMSLLVLRHLHAAAMRRSDLISWKETEQTSKYTWPTFK